MARERKKAFSCPLISLCAKSTKKVWTAAAPDNSPPFSLGRFHPVLPRFCLGGPAENFKAERPHSGKQQGRGRSCGSTCPPFTANQLPQGTAVGKATRRSPAPVRASSRARERAKLREPRAAAESGALPFCWRPPLGSFP